MDLGRDFGVGYGVLTGLSILLWCNSNNSNRPERHMQCNPLESKSHEIVHKRVDSITY